MCRLKYRDPAVAEFCNPLASPTAAQSTLLSSSSKNAFAAAVVMPSLAAWVIVVPVSSFGVTPATTAIFGVTVPRKIKLPAPDESVPTPKCVTVPPAPLAIAANVAIAVRLAVLLDTVKPAPDRATAIRAYAAITHSCS